jgi:hypothetical protein
LAVEDPIERGGRYGIAGSLVPMAAKGGRDVDP